MKIPKCPKIISSKIHKNIDGSISYGIQKGFLEKETDFSFQVKKDKLQKDLYYNEVLYIRQNSTICSFCGKRRWKKDIKKIISPYEFGVKNKCKFCESEQQRLSAEDKSSTLPNGNVR